MHKTDPRPESAWESAFTVKAFYVPSMASSQRAGHQVVVVVTHNRAKGPGVGLVIFLVYGHNSFLEIWQVP